MKLNRRRVAAVVIVVTVVCAAVWLIISRRGSERPFFGGPTTVQLAQVESGEVVRTLEAVGRIEAAQSVVVTAEASGRIQSILFQDGQTVSAGQPLFRLRSDEERANLAAAEAEALALRQRLARLRRLLPDGAVPAGEVEDLEGEVAAADARAAALRTLVNETVIRAPFAGVVGLREVSPGALVQPGDALASLDNARTVRVRFSLPQSQLGRVSRGSRVIVTDPARPGRSFEGRLESFDSRLMDGQRTLQAQARLDNRESFWRPGMLADVVVEAETNPQGLTIPTLAMQLRGDSKYVFRAVEGCAQRVDVQAGERRSDRIEILSGLSPSDRVVVAGFTDLTSGDPITEASGPPPSGSGGPPNEKSDGPPQGAEKEGGGGPDPEAFQREQERCRALVERAQPQAAQPRQGQAEEPGAPRS